MLEAFDSVLLSRLQFAFTVGFHILWPSLTIGLGLFLLITEIVWLKTKDKTYVSIHKFFSKIFALSFGMGVITGIPMAFQFGTNFGRFSEFAAPVIGPLLANEVLTAFFLEASFIGVMIFGWKKIPPKIHLLATFLVVLGTHNSAFWIIVVNSWMQTPSGIEIIDGVINVTSWKEVIFNPSMPYRLCHMLIASYLTAISLVCGVSAYLILKNKNIEVVKKSWVLALSVMSVLAPLQILVGDMHGLEVLRSQPLKIASMEGNWETRKGIPLVLFAVPDEKEERNKYEIALPKVSSLILTHHLDGEVKGIKDWPKEERPKVGIVFWSFRIMVGIGMLYLVVILGFLFLKIRKKLHDAKYFMLLTILLIPTGFVAIIAGWFVAEVGRQPYVIYGIMKTVDSTSLIPQQHVLYTLITLVIIYTLLLIGYLIYVIGLIRKGPEDINTIEVYKKIN